MQLFIFNLFTYSMNGAVVYDNSKCLSHVTVLLNARTILELINKPCWKHLERYTQSATGIQLTLGCFPHLSLPCQLLQNSPLHLAVVCAAVPLAGLLHVWPLRSLWCSKYSAAWGCLVYITYQGSCRGEDKGQLKY